MTSAPGLHLWLGLWAPDILPTMSQPLTANDLLPLVARLDPAERRRLVYLIDATAERDAAIYASAPAKQDEFASDNEQLGWDADGWENVK